MNDYNNLMVISGDVYQTIKSVNEIGWKAIKESSINRVLYLAAAIYSFRFPDVENIFQDTYKFIITLSGPEDANIKKALTNLESNENIMHDQYGYIVKDKEYSKQLEKIPMFTEKKIWIEDIAYIIGVYGEEKIYDFIFRDPEYKEALRSNSIHTLDITAENKTVQFLNTFKNDFEKHISDKTQTLGDRKYLELYFEYVFGKILRGE